MSTKSRAALAPAVISWLPVLVWAMLIATFSTDEFGGSWSLVWVTRIVRFAWPEASTDTILAIHFALRKIAHVAEYAIFAMLLVRAFRSATGPSPRAPVATAIVVAALYALTDEAHQALSMSRTGSFWDCALDSVGAALGGFLVRSRTPSRTRTVMLG